MKKKHILIVAALCLLWIGLHIPGVIYGTSHTPLHVSYLTADEQLPINGALHILEEKNPLGVRSSVNYYGPVFALIGVPAVVVDFVCRLATGAVSGSASYKDFIVWSWGGILAWARVIALLVGFLGLWAVYRLFQKKTLNPSGRSLIPKIAVALLGLNYLYFEYSNFFRHWIFIVSIALWQMYLMICLMENPARGKKYWTGLVALTVISFGISYFSIVYSVMWLPLLFIWAKTKDWKSLRSFVVFVVCSVIGFAIVIWWYPYPFERMLSVAGLIPTFTSVGAVMDITTAPASTSSLYFYLQVIFTNNLLLIIAGIILLCALLRKQRIYARYWFWMFMLPAALNLIIFSIPAHHESRYALPTIVFSILTLVALFALALEKQAERTGIIRVIGTLMGLSLILNAVTIIGWERMISAGPPERREIVPQMISWARENPSATVLALNKTWPFGYVHTPAAYQNFVETRGKGSSDLWQYILNSASPANVTPVNVFYTASTSVSLSDKKRFDHIVLFNPGHTDESVWNGSPNDQFDLKPWTAWNFAAYQDSFTILK